MRPLDAILTANPIMSEADPAKSRTPMVTGATAVRITETSALTNIAVAWMVFNTAVKGSPNQSHWCVLFVPLRIGESSQNL
jgi:hypothetical protein